MRGSVSDISFSSLHCTYTIRYVRLASLPALLSPQQPGSVAYRACAQPPRPTKKRGKNEREEGRKEGENISSISGCSFENKSAKRIFPIPIPVFSNLFLTTKGRKKGWQHSRPSYLEQKEKRWLDIAAPTFQLRRETRRASRQFPRESRKFAENAVARDLIA